MCSATPRWTCGASLKNSTNRRLVRYSRACGSFRSKKVFFKQHGAGKCEASKPKSSEWVSLGCRNYLGFPHRSTARRVPAHRLSRIKGAPIAYEVSESEFGRSSHSDSAQDSPRDVRRTQDTGETRTTGHQLRKGY